MKRKRCFKAILSGLLAAAMIVTAAPADCLLTVSAAQTETLDDDAASVLETGGAQDEQTPGTEVTPEDGEQSEETTSKNEGDTVKETTPESEGNTAKETPASTTSEDGTEAGEENPDEENPIEEEPVVTDAADAPTVVSPDVNGKDVTFRFYAPDAKKVMVKGSHYENWTPVEMDFDLDTGIWSKTFYSLSYGLYKYGYDVDGTYTHEPSNTDGQDDKFAIAGIVDYVTTVIRGGDAKELPTTLKAYDSEGKEIQAAVTYALSEESQQYASAVTISEKQDSTAQTITVNSNLDESVTQITLTATDTDNNKGTVIVKVFPKAYTETITESPVINGNSVTFYYRDLDAIRVWVHGQIKGEGWTDSDDMTFDYDTGYWKITLPMSAGVWAYGIKADGNWNNDPLNSNHNKDGNDLVYVSGLKWQEHTLARGKSKPLDAQLDCYDNKGNSTPTAVTYEKSAETTAAAYSDKITLTTTEDGTTVSITDDFPADVKSFTLTAKDDSTNTAVITINVIDREYTYTIYYFDPVRDDISKDNTQLWVWEDGGGGPDKAVDFIDSEQLSDGRTWLKATVSLPYTSLGMKSREYGTWDGWQDSKDWKYSNTEKKDEVTLYYIIGETLSDTLPEVQGPSRYLVVQYTRTTQTDQDWYFYTWNSGYTGFYKFNYGIAYAPLAEGVSSVSFCLERPYIDGDDIPEGNKVGDHWGDKDGDDYVCSFPSDQKVVKIVMEEGKGITKKYPNNVGYEIEPAANTIHFYYRDDEEFKEGDTSSYTSVNVEVGMKDENGSLQKQSIAMTFSNDNQRYEADYTPEGGLKSCDYYYRYVCVKDSATENVLDAFNSEEETIGDVQYSVCKYEILALDVKAVMQNPTMDYNDNNVLTITAELKQSNEEGKTENEEVKTESEETNEEENEEANEEETKEVEISRATVDLTSVGGSVLEINPELMQISIAVKEGTATGPKELPVVVYDKFNNEYKTTAVVNIAPRTKNGDFDWDEAVIYFAVTDRFFDGNAGNNGIGYNDSETGSSSYHGGDFAGLTQKLDYLQNLGVNTIWITPIVENQTEPNNDDLVGESWGYHGYWAKDFEKLDSHLGTEAEFKALLDAAHARGIKIMVDVVLNHSGYGDEITDYFNNYELESGEKVRMLRQSDEMVNGDDQKSSLAGLPDFLTENKEVRELLVEWQSKWISKYDIDYYRVDTVKHVDSTTWTAFKNALTEINPEFKMIGEWAGAGYATDTGALRSGQMDALLDFDFNGRATSFVKGDISNVESFMVSRNAAIDNTATLGAFLSSHDEDGFVYHLINGEKISETQAHNLALVAASLQLTAKGQVVIYYGEEIGMTGADNYPYQTNRYDFDWSEIDADNATLAHYKAMLAIRNRYSEVLAKGGRVTIAADDANGLDVFTRSYNGTTLRVALNIKDSAQEYTLTGLTAGTVLYDYYATYKTGVRKAYTVDATGEVTITIPAAADGGTVVLAEVAPEVEGAIVQEGFDVKPIADHPYTAKNITLSEEELVVYYDGKPLKIKTDYTVSYKNNKAPGTATVTIKGKGNYAGTVTTEFTITKKNVNDEDIVIDYKDLVANNKAQKPLTKITNNGVKLGTKDYTVKYYLLYKNGSRAGSALTSVKGVGTYEMVITGTGNYTGTKTIKVNVINGTYMNKTSVTLKWAYAAGQEPTIVKAGIPYTGQEIKPTVEVTKGSGKNKETVSSDCYEVIYSNNIEVGTASVKVKGITAKGYCGEVVKTFKIEGVKLSSVAEVDTAKWANNVEIDVTRNPATAVQPKENEGLLKVKTNAPAGTTLTYTVTYTKNDKPGTATATFTGIGQYTGTMKKTFKVDAVDLSGIKATADEAGSVYTVEASTPYRAAGARAAVTVTYKGITLVENRDYTLTYSANKAVSTTAKVKITGKGAFKGKIENIPFEVTQVDLASLPVGISLTVPDIAYVNKANKYQSVPVLDGVKLKASEYTLTYKVWEDGDWAAKDKNYKAPAGTRVQVTITPIAGKNSSKYYTGNAIREYQVVEADISKAKVTIKAQEYTGKEITLGKSDFSSVKVGNAKLVLGSDFEIVEGSYTNNINKGTASVTIRGIGNYTGEKKVTFKITSRFMTWWWNLFR